MRASDHLARRPRPGSEPGPEPPAPRRWSDSLLGVLCCVLDLLLSGFGGALSGGWLAGAEPSIAVTLPVTAVAVPALVYRRRAPRLVFGGMWLHGIGAMLTCGFRPVTGLALALHAITVRARCSTGFLALSVAVAPSAVGTLVAATGRSGARPALALGIAATVLTGGWLAGQRAHARYRRETLRRRRQEAQRAQAAADERYRVTHDLLGIITHCLSAMLLQAAGARRVLDCDPEQAAKALATIETTALQATGELYRLLGVLRTSGLSQVGALQLAPHQNAADPATATPPGQLALGDLHPADTGPNPPARSGSRPAGEAGSSDGALELLVADRSRADRSGDRIPGDRASADQVPNPRSTAHDTVAGGTGPPPGSLSRSAWLSESA